MKYNDLIPEFIVTDIERSKAFYVELLGFCVEYERAEDRFVFLTKGSIQLMFEQGSEEQLASLTYPFGQGVNFTFGMDDVDDVYERVVASGYPVLHELTERTFRVDDDVVVEKEFNLMDPDGYDLHIST